MENSVRTLAAGNYWTVKFSISLSYLTETSLYRLYTVVLFGLFADIGTHETLERPYHTRFGFSPLVARIDSKVLLFVFKALNGLAPSWISDPLTGPSGQLT